MQCSQLVSRPASTAAGVVSFCTPFGSASDRGTISYSKYRGSVNSAANTVTPTM